MKLPRGPFPLDLTMLALTLLVLFGPGVAGQDDGSTEDASQVVLITPWLGNPPEARPITLNVTLAVDHQVANLSLFWCVTEPERGSYCQFPAPMTALDNTTFTGSGGPYPVGTQVRFRLIVEFENGSKLTLPTDPDYLVAGVETIDLDGSPYFALDYPGSDLTSASPPAEEAEAPGLGLTDVVATSVILAARKPDRNRRRRGP